MLTGPAPIGRTEMRLTIAATAAALLAGPALAQSEALPLPPDCAGFLTVQSKGCIVTNYFRCETDPEGVQRYVTYFEDRLTGASVVDEEFQWLESYGAEREEILGETPDPASITELFEAGEDSYEFELIEQTRGGERRYRVVGVDRLEGGEVEIDGEPLSRTVFAMKRIDDETGEEILSVTGAQYVSEYRRLFFSGTETLSIGGRTVEIDHSPVEFIEPGEPGFFATTPIYGCGVQDTAY